MSRTITLVTGASRGIGKAVAKRFAKEGHFVIGTATTEKGAALINDYLHDSGGIGRVLDVRDGAQIEKLFEEIESVYGAVQVLVTNAGITQDGLLMRMKEQEWDDVIDTNLKGVFNCIQKVTPQMLRQKSGAIINLSSVVGAMGNPGQANYVATKAGVIGLTKSAARELASRNITVNAVAPGFIVSDMTDQLNDELNETMKLQIPLAKFGEAIDIANAVSFLASDKAKYITGQTLHVNGGMCM